MEKDKRCTNCDRFPFCDFYQFCVFSSNKSTCKKKDYWIKRENKEVRKCQN